MVVSEKTYEAIALEEPENAWELANGLLRRKPPMTLPHNDVGRRLFLRLAEQLNEDEWVVSFNSARLLVRQGVTHFVPDVAVIPMHMTAGLWGRQDRLEEYTAPVPFVAEVWSPSTGEYDVETKFPEYRARGDREIWRVHPYERTVIAWRRQADESYRETLYKGGEIPVESLPGVVIRLESLFR